MKTQYAEPLFFLDSTKEAQSCGLRRICRRGCCCNVARTLSRAMGPVRIATAPDLETFFCLGTNLVPTA